MLAPELWPTDTNPTAHSLDIQGRQAATNVALMASSQQWLVAAAGALWDQNFGNIFGGQSDSPIAERWFNLAWQSMSGFDQLGVLMLCTWLVADTHFPMLSHPLRLESIAPCRCGAPGRSKQPQLPLPHLASLGSLCAPSAAGKAIMDHSGSNHPLRLWDFEEFDPLGSGIQDIQASCF